MNTFVKKKEHSEDPEDAETEAAPVMAVIRLVSSDGSSPKMGVALARSTDNIDYMVWVRVRKFPDFCSSKVRFPKLVPP